MIQVGDIVEAQTEKCKFVGYYLGKEESNGKTYIIVSPYDDDRPKHYLELDTPLRKVAYENVC